MAKVKKTHALLAVLFVLVGVGLLPMRKVGAAGANDWNEGSESSATTVTANMVVSSGSVLLDAITLSSITVPSGYVIIRDSNPTANSVVTLVFFSSDTTTGLAAVTGLYRTFPRPLRFNRGLASEATSCPTGTALCYTLHFRRVSDVR